jgi:hypothetical protein
MDDLTGDVQAQANLCPTSQQSGLLLDTERAQGGPGSPVGVIPLPIDSDVTPLPLNTPRRAWEREAPATRPGAADWQEDQPGLGAWKLAGFAPSPGWMTRPDGLGG